eukprot:scaffold94532_cov75-Phaeocystis_antarctica.AAC.6
MRAVPADARAACAAQEARGHIPALAWAARSLFLMMGSYVLCAAAQHKCRFVCHCRRVVYLYRKFGSLHVGRKPAYR